MYNPQVCIYIKTVYMDSKTENDRFIVVIDVHKKPYINHLQFRSH